MSAFLSGALEGMHHDGGSSLLQPSTIVPMETNSIRRIVAGQAVTDLASAVKELVDNALDAGATGINIRLWNSGAKILEVSDDGSGIPLSSRPYIALKNATSKIRSFEDIYGGANTLGFRGEALFCLANISQQLLVCTRTASDELGQRLSFGRDGYLDPESVCQAPRKVGTTVAVVGLFDALPVRKADMIKRVKKQRAKLLKMMQGYAVLCTGVRFNLMDMGPGNKENTILATSAGNGGLEQTISSVLGSRFLSGLTRLSVDLTSAIDGNNTTGSPWKVEGLVSKAPIVTGRGGAPSREVQFFSINHRPVELPRISRALGDAWRAIEGTTTKRPACALYFTLPNNAYDVNLSPDKRDVFLRDDVAICELIRAAATALWASQSDGTFAANEVELLSQQQHKSNASVASPGDHSPTSNGSPSSGLRRRARRRMAFVHDLNNARMQHEGGERMESMQGTILRDEDDWTEESVSDKMEISSSVSPGASEESAETEAGEYEKAAQPTPEEDSSNKRDRTSDRERIRWSQTQLQFNKVSSHERQSQQDEISLLEKPEERRPLDQKDGNEAVPVVSQSQKATTVTTIGQQVSPASRPNTDEKKVIGLEQFAFAPIGQDAASQGNHKRKAASTENIDQSLRAKSRTTRTTPLASNNMDNIVSTSIVTPVEPHDEGEPSRVQPTTQRSTCESFQRNTRKSQLSNHRKENAVEMEDSDAASSSEDSPVRPRKLQRRNSGTGEGPEDSTGKSPVVWDSFQGTDHIIQAAKLARLSMRKQRKQLRNDIKARNETNKSKTSTVASNNDVDEEVAVEDLEDQSESSGKGVVRLRKDIFRDMKIVGQFNLGFILARCRNNHLWILDQHACDEKYNFERLCAETVIHEQKLIAPLPLELSPSEESCILDNMEVFEQNGFRFSYDSEKPPRHRLALTALPHSGAPDGRKAVQFGKEDVTALCEMLEADGDSYAEAGGGYGTGTGADGSGVYGNNAVRRYAGGHSQLDKSSQKSDDGDAEEEKNVRKIITRLPKAIAMFASRACRGSVMIGTALSEKEMGAIVKKLAEISDPWSCAHGRPTMRHVRDLAPTLLQEEKKAEFHVAGPTLAVMSQFQELDNTQEVDE